jgi:hypothetical protein
VEAVRAALDVSFVIYMHSKELGRASNSAILLHLALRAPVYISGLMAEEEALRRRVASFKGTGLPDVC